MTKDQDITREEGGFLETVKSNLKTIAWAVVIAGIIRSLLFEPFHIPSSSMKDTLLTGDFIIVSKSSYGYSKYSFPFAMFPFKGRVFSEKPERGDVSVFRLPSNPRINYIKRLIGLPGDTIQIVNGELYLNGELVKRTMVGMLDDGDGPPAVKYQETLPGGKSYYVLDQVLDGLKDNTPIYTVPKGHYFFLGDNRDNSQDSRYLNKVGFISEEHLIGKAKFIFMSSEDSLLKLWAIGKNIRFKRLFKEITSLKLDHKMQA